MSPLNPQTAGATFAGDRPRPLDNQCVDFDKAVHVLSPLLEGMSIRAASRITGMHKRTVLSLLVLLGRKCQAVLGARVRDLRAKFVRMDELWTSVHTKEAHLRHGDPAEWGDACTWVALDSEIISHLVAKGEGPSALEIVTDFSKSVAGRPKLPRMDSDRTSEQWKNASAPTLTFPDSVRFAASLITRDRIGTRHPKLSKRVHPESVASPISRISAQGMSRDRIRIN